MLLSWQMWAANALSRDIMLRGQSLAICHVPLVRLGKAASRRSVTSSKDADQQPWAVEEGPIKKP